MVFLHPVDDFVHTHQKTTGNRIRNEIIMLCQLLLDLEKIDGNKEELYWLQWTLLLQYDDEVNTEDLQEMEKFLCTF